MTVAFDWHFAVLCVFIFQVLPYFLQFLSGLQLPGSWKWGAKMKIIIGRDGNESVPRRPPAFYIAQSSLQEQGNGELLAAPMLWRKYILACRERAEDTNLCSERCHHVIILHGSTAFFCRWVVELVVFTVVSKLNFSCSHIRNRGKHRKQE